MNENGPDVVDRLHREAVERHCADKERERALVEAMFEQAVQRERQEQERLQGLIEQSHQQALERMSNQAPAAPASQLIHFSELPEAQLDSPLRCEWNTYRREVGQLLASGYAGRHVLIKGAEIIGLWETANEALTAGYRSFPGEPFLVRQVREQEPVLRCVSVRSSCPNMPIPFRQAS